MKPSENPLGSEPVSSLLRRFAIPSVIAMLVSALYNMVASSLSVTASACSETQRPT